MNYLYFVIKDIIVNIAFTYVGLWDQKTIPKL
jgi:hypothetical protein